MSAICWRINDIGLIGRLNALIREAPEPDPYRPNLADLRDTEALPCAAPPPRVLRSERVLASRAGAVSKKGFRPPATGLMLATRASLSPSLSLAEPPLILGRASHRNTPGI
jgi:hypothetical protein